METRTLGVSSPVRFEGIPRGEDLEKIRRHAAEAFAKQGVDFNALPADRFEYFSAEETGRKPRFSKSWMVSETVKLVELVRTALKNNKPVTHFVVAADYESPEKARKTQAFFQSGDKWPDSKYQDKPLVSGVAGKVLRRILGAEITMTRLTGDYDERYPNQVISLMTVKANR